MYQRSCKGKGSISVNKNVPGNGSKNAAVKGCIILVVLAVCLGVLGIWTRLCEERAHIAPEGKKVSIKELVEKSDWNAADYNVLSEQTGLFPEALLYLKENGRTEELLSLQEAYFRPVQIACRPNTLITREERVADAQGYPAEGISIPYVEEGDILITGCSHFLGWRNGHAAIVVDAEKRLILEAQVWGEPAVIASMDYWERYPSFMVLRLEGADKEERAAIAAYAEQYLIGVPYRLTAGIYDRFMHKKPVVTPAGTQCAHLVWYAFNIHGYNLDSDKGVVVTPRDIADSDKLKVIQYYGIEQRD